MGDRNGPEHAAISKDKKTVRNFRDTEFAKMGFSDLYFLKNGQE